MGELFQPTHLLILLAICVLLFGGKKLLELEEQIRSKEAELAEAKRGAKDTVRDINRDVRK